ncbi:MAG: AcrB/AcrD/AcrF family protein, partial [Ferruginibacter sp.]
MIGIGILLDIAGVTFLGNLLIFFMILVLLNRYFIEGAIHYFQNRALPFIMGHYESLLRWSLKGWRPVHLLLGTIALLIFSFMVFSMAISSGRVGITFFPKADPNQLYVYIKLPVGTSVEYTDSITQLLEKRVTKVLGVDYASNKRNPVVESVISNVAIGASDPSAGDRSTRSELGRIQVSFVEFEKRHGVSTRPYLDSVRAAMRGIPGAEISVDQEGSGPPTDPPVN